MAEENPSALKIASIVSVYQGRRSIEPATIQDLRQLISDVCSALRANQVILNPDRFNQIDPSNNLSQVLTFVEIEEQDTSRVVIDPGVFEYRTGDLTDRTVLFGRNDRGVWANIRLNGVPKVDHFEMVGRGQKTKVFQRIDLLLVPHFEDWAIAPQQTLREVSLEPPTISLMMDSFLGGLIRTSANFPPYLFAK